MKIPFQVCDTGRTPGMELTWVLKDILPGRNFLARSAMNLYLIPAHVYLCKTCDGFVFLNLRDDKYIGLGGEELQYLHTVISGWPTCGVADDKSKMLERVRHVANELHRAGLLTTDTATGKTAQIPVNEMLEGSLFDQLQDTTPHISPALFTRVAYAIVIVSGILKFRSLEWAINRVRLRKSARTNRDITAATASITTLTRSFFRLRPLLYSAHNRCLFDCLVLLEFLAGFGRFPTLVFGVKTFPFKAHCWLQMGTLVLTDPCERIREYVPILVV